MNLNDVVEFMEQNCGLKEGYAKNPVSKKRMEVVANELKQVGITKITNKNKEQVAYVTSKYVRDGNLSYSLGDNNGMDSHYCTESYRGNIKEDGTYEEVNTKINKILLDSHPTRQEESIRSYNKYGLETNRKEKFKETTRDSSFEESYDISRDEDLVTSTIVGSKTVDGKERDKITQKVLLLDETLSPQTMMDYDVSAMKGYYDEMEKQKEELKDGYVIAGSLLAIDGKEVNHTNKFYMMKSNFDYNCMVSPEFRETAKERGMYLEQPTVSRSKMKEIYDKVNDKLKSVADKFTRKTKEDKTQDMQY